MNNPTPSQPGSPPPVHGDVSTRPVAAPAPVVYRYTQKFRQEWQHGAPTATWGTRLVALLVDFLVIGLPFNLLYNFIFGFLPEELPPIGRNLLFWLVFGLVTSLCAYRFGASPGKKLMNLVVVRQSHTRLSFLQLFLRETLVGYSLVSLYVVVNFLMLSGLNFLHGFNLLYLPGPILALGGLPLFLGKPRPPLHDRLFKTTVVIADMQKYQAN